MPVPSPELSTALTELLGLYREWLKSGKLVRGKLDAPARQRLLGKVERLEALLQELG